jgi:hypothetical protein
MKSTIEFNLPEEREELNDALNGSRYKSRINTLYDEVFRPHLKYGKPLIAKSELEMEELTQEQLAIIQQVWDNVFNHLEDCLDE